MKRLSATLLLLAALGAAFSLPARAEYRLSDQDRADIARVEAYLNSLETIRSRFVQLVSGGRFSEGTLYIERPNRLRLDYKKPATTQVYANGNWLIHVDTELEAVTHVPINVTIAGFLVRKKIRLGGDIVVQRVTRADGAITLQLAQADEPEAGRFTLTLTEKPLRLQKWTVVDPQGITTNVTLLAPRFNEPVNREVFVFDDSQFERELQ